MLVALCVFFLWACAPLRTAGGREDAGRKPKQHGTKQGESSVNREGGGKIRLTKKKLKTKYVPNPFPKVFQKAFPGNKKGLSPLPEKAFSKTFFQETKKK